VTFSRAKLKHHQLKESQTRPMVQMGLRRSSSFWVEMNLAADRTAKILPASTRVRYEDACHEPTTVIASLAQFVGLSMPPGLVGADGTFERRREHTVGGNPDRWTTGRDQIRVDDKWKHDLPRASSGAVTAMTLPLLIKYGYPIAARRRAA
jgi:hypothetical protein